MTTRTEQRTCEQHGPYEGTEYFAGRWSGCPACMRAEELQRQQEAERSKHARRQGELIARSGVIGRYLQTTLDNFTATTKEQRSVLATCRQFVQELRPDQGHGLILIGPPGVGKSHLGSAMVLRVIQQHAQLAHIVTARDIVRAVRDTWRRDATESEADVIERYASYSLLVLDEVGIGFDTENERLHLFEVLDLRYTLQRPTVVLSNLNQKDLRDALGPRSFDRVREGTTTLLMNWESHREHRAHRPADMPADVHPRLVEARGLSTPKAEALSAKVQPRER